MAIEIRGANEHNLKDVDVDIGDGLTVVTGVSGSGKTSLVFDTLYHEARRRFLEIFSLGQRLSPANVRSIAGLGPAIAVAQNLLNRNPGSTLATASGLHPFLRLLYTHFGERGCPYCGAALAVFTEDEIVERLSTLSGQGAITVHAPLLRNVRGSHRTLLASLTKAFGAEYIFVDGESLADAENLVGFHKSVSYLDPTMPHDLTVQIAHLDAQAPVAQIREAVQRAWSLGATAVALRTVRGQVPLAPVSLQNRKSEIQSLTLSRAPVCAQCGAWFGELSPVHFHTACPHCNGDGCQQCAGTGLHPDAAAVRWEGLRLPDLLSRSVDDIAALFARVDLPSSAGRLRQEIVRRLDALARVGLGYIALDRSSPTLSRGESQRVRLAIALTSRLEDMLHVLDEPTIGQHPADVARLLPAFRDLAGPVVYVEHDRVAAAYADHAIDLGPGAGSKGGEVIFSGTTAELWREDTPTGRYFSLRERVALPEARPAPETFLTVRDAHLRTLQHIDVPIPLGRLTVVTGVSGSGKSTFVEDVLAASLTSGSPAGCVALDGPVLKAVMVDQSPIGKNPRSNPATYTKLADIIRDAFSAATGLSPSHFSFNRPEGACPDCQGIGAVEVAMRYMPSTWIPCATCDGQRFTDEVLAATVDFRASHEVQRLSIADFYKLSIAEVRPLLVKSAYVPEKGRRAAGRILRALCDIGLGYLSLGQPSPTLSGGEAQRVKLAKYLGRRALNDQMLILDEPSTGLHPRDVAGLLVVLDRLVRSGATVVVVEHNTDIIRAADWVVDLGPGAGLRGGRVLYAGPPAGLFNVTKSLTAQALRDEESANLQINKSVNQRISKSEIKNPQSAIEIRGARAHNLKNVDVSIPKGQLVVVTGVSGSGKSSLVGDVLEAEARRRFLETLSLYERQGTREGAEAPVDAITGLGVTVTVEGGGLGAFGRRDSVGTATEIAHHVAVLLSHLGDWDCPNCGTPLVRRGPSRQVAAAQRGAEWHCPSCKAAFPVAAPRHFSPSIYAAACTTCHGVGTLRQPNPGKLIVEPDKPLCGGAMYSPGFFPQGYLCKPMNGGYEVVQALAEHLGFDPVTTPWNAMSPEAQYAFLFGYPDKLRVIHESRNGRTSEHWWHYPGFFGWIRDWDVGGTYTDTKVCPACHGARLRPEYASVTLSGYTMYDLSEMTLAQLSEVMAKVSELRVTNHELRIAHSESTLQLVDASLTTIRKRLRFLLHVGLSYLHLNRDTATLSAGEAQRIKLAGLLGNDLTSLTVLLDEPSRGMHPSEVDALITALRELRDRDGRRRAANTLVVVEHDLGIIRAADYVIDVGPGAGVDGGKIVAQGTPEQILHANTVTGRWLRDANGGWQTTNRQQRAPKGWMVIRGARANNLRGEDVRLPLGCLVGICGVSGSGKSTLLIDTLGRALAPKKQTTSVAYEPVDPGEHDAIEGAPARAILVDQAKAGVHSPASFLGLTKPLYALFAASDDAQALGLDEKALGRGCSVCGGRGSTTLDMGFLPNVHILCEACQGTGFRPEAWEVRLRGVALPDVFCLTLDEVYALFGDQPALECSLTAARDVGLGYLVLRQPGYALSGGEAQRLKIAKELARTGSRREVRRKALGDTLYILDEPTVGQHMEDVARLSGVLHQLVDKGHTVFVVEHHTHLLAACDWLIELGPGGGPEGGRIVAQGPPAIVAAGNSPTSTYLREVLGVR